MIRFLDPGMTFKNDSEKFGKIFMYLPSDMFQNVLDVLRNEKPVYIRFHEGCANLTTSREPAGEEET
jgi:hypothetical protein